MKITKVQKIKCLVFSFINAQECWLVSRQKTFMFIFAIIDLIKSLFLKQVSLDSFLPLIVLIYMG